MLYCDSECMWHFKRALRALSMGKGNYLHPIIFSHSESMDLQKKFNVHNVTFMEVYIYLNLNTSK